MINFKTWALPEKKPAIPCKSLYLNIVNFKLFLVFLTKKNSAFWCCIPWNTEVYGQAKLRGASGNSFIHVVCRRDLQTCAALRPERISQYRNPWKDCIKVYFNKEAVALHRCFCNSLA